MRVAFDARARPVETVGFVGDPRQIGLATSSQVRYTTNLKLAWASADKLSEWVACGRVCKRHEATTSQRMEELPAPKPGVVVLAARRAG